MPEDPKPPSNTPRRHRPRLTELAKETTEEDLWVLDDDEISDAPAVPTVEPEPAPELELELETAAAPKKAEAPEEPDEEPPTEEPAAPEPEKPTEPKPKEPAVEKAPKPEPAAEPEDKPAAPSQPAASTATSLPKPERKEWIGLGILGVVFLTLAIWWVVGLFSSVTTTRFGEDEPDFPIQGSFIEAQTCTTFWRKPIRDADQPDVARNDVLYIPVAKITLDGEGTGVLRAIFRDDQNEFVGDSITRSFTAGHFDDSGSPTVEFPATSGFMEDADFNAYRVGGERWTIEILEGPSANAAGSEFKSLFKASISSLRR